MAYIDALLRLEFLITETKSADKTLLDEARKLINNSLELQEQAFAVLGKAHDSSRNKNQELEDDIINQYMFMNDFEEIEGAAEKSEQERESEQLKISRLDPSGFTETNKALHDCAGAVVKKAKELFKSEPVMAQVWSYRWGGYDMISCDLYSQDRTVSMPVTISAVERQMLEYLDEPEVFDMAEAVHLAGLITKALDAKVIVGLWRNEVNPDVLTKPLGEGYSNGEINLWKQES
ncbi:hypothetical protein [Yersinia sp. 2105 StPb PI]|uniref:hypothetical protein n=1 Tax=Yersinia sp. 2105 StPb PI TaxID=2507058 RepID=UPI000FFB2940|nr:hypothetical protein [Yersinia sp. 2105 StPb PI]EKN4845613.1 hypothetical protein [Yersinia enterocolitica]EKN5065610.1 hypothetical protein [Yersinia enterocolitica]RXA94074.1 hypothetical protein EQP49_20955 [Yersinia sp. 2105 StPb PI]